MFRITFISLFLGTVAVACNSQNIKDTKSQSKQIEELAREIILSEFVPNRYLDAAKSIVNKLNEEFPQDPQHWSCIVGSEYGVQADGLRYYIFFEVSEKKLFVHCFIH